MNVGALSGYPVPMVQVTVTDDLQVQMQVEHLATFDWYGRPVDAVAYTRDHACNLLRRLLSAGSPADFAQKLDALQLPGRKLLPLYPLVKPLFRLLRTGTVRDLQRTLRRLGLGRYVDAGRRQNWRIGRFCLIWSGFCCNLWTALPIRWAGIAPFTGWCCLS